MEIQKIIKLKKLIPFIILLLLPLFLANFLKVKKIITRALYTKANISVNSVKKEPNYFLNWLSFSQGGEEPNVDMLKPVQPYLTALNPQYIRIDHIFDDDFYGIIKPSENGYSYDFSRLDETVNTIVQSGAKPLLVLSYMPQVLSPDKTGLPTNWRIWQELVATTIEHYSGMNHKNLDSVYYEVWNEPDLESFGGFNYYGSKNYLELYRYSAQAALNTKFCNPFKLGGPATTDLYQNWITALLDFAKENQLPLNFLSYHQYSQSVEDYEKNINNLNQWLTDYNPSLDVEIILSEWGPDSSPNPTLYNSKTAAAHSLAVISQLGSKINQAFAFEIKDGPTTNSWGLIGHETQETKLKPRYHLFTWIAELKSALNFSGSGTFVKAVAGSKNNATVILISNYDPDGSHQELVPVRIYNLKPGPYKLLKEYLSEKATSQTITLNSSVWQDEIYLPPNSVIRLQLIPL